MKLVGYTRVDTNSAKNQKELDYQELVIRERCEEHGFGLVGIASEVVNVDVLKQQPQLVKALEVIHTTDCDGLIVLNPWSVGSLLTWCDLVEILGHSKKFLITADAVLDCNNVDSVSNRMLLNLRYTCHELEEQVKRERIARLRKAKRITLSAN